MLDLIKSFFETSKERLKNPLIGTFIISWIAINWRPLSILLFSNQSIENRIDTIVSCYSSFNTYFLTPFLIALAYVIILPYFMWTIDGILKKSVIGRKKNVIKLLAIDLQGKQELALEENKLEDIKANFREKADLNKTIEKLKLQLEDRDKTIESQRIGLNTLNEDYAQLKSIVEKDKTTKLSEKEIKKLEKEYLDFKKSDLYDDFRVIGLAIRNSSDFPSSINDIIKEKYLYQNIVDKINDEENRRTYYEFTDKGHFFWKEYIMNITVTKRGKVPPPPSDDDLPF